MRKKVIIDCDPGIDDSLAIMLALSCDQIEVLGITIVCGNSPTEMGAGNAAKALRQMNRLDIPIFTGERTPLKRDYVNALDTHGADGLGESFLEPVENFSFHTDAVSFLEETILNTHCSVIALGPMTNLALSSRKILQHLLQLMNWYRWAVLLRVMAIVLLLLSITTGQILMLLRLSMRQRPCKIVLSIWLASM